MSNEKIMEYNGKKTNYIITDKGVIYSLNYRGSGKKKKMKQFDHKGYRCSNITIDGKCKRLLVHRLVAENFISNPYNKPEVNHKSGKKKNNKVSNLEWCTHHENMIHASRKGFMPHNLGEKNGKSKITKKQAKKICKLLQKNKLSLDEIAELVGTTRGIVYSIKYGYTWSDVSKKYNVKKHNIQPKRKKYNKKSSKKLSESTVISICDDLEKTDLTIEELSKKYSVPKGKIEAIRYGNSWVCISNNYDFSKRNKYKKG